MDGSFNVKDKIRFMATGAEYLVEQLGVFTPKAVSRDTLSAGGSGLGFAV